jgi:hypothetical protein
MSYVWDVMSCIQSQKGSQKIPFKETVYFYETTRSHIQADFQLHVFEKFSPQLLAMHFVTFATLDFLI